MKYVSIIVCGYNEERYVKKSIDSLLGQSYEDIEIIFIDDGSDDSTLEIVRGYEDERIRIFANRTNIGLAASRNIGLEAARGEYIGFFDADDVAINDRIEAQVNFLEVNPEVGMVGGACDFIDEKGRIIRNRNLYSVRADEDIRGGMLFANVLLAGGVLFRKNIIEKYKIKNNPELRIAQDYLFWVDMLPHCQVVNLDKVLYHYRIGHGSKASVIKGKDPFKWDFLIKQIVSTAWSNEGISLSDKDIDFVYNYFFKGCDENNYENFKMLLNIHNIICEHEYNKGVEGISGIRRQFFINIMRHQYAKILRLFSKYGLW